MYKTPRFMHSASSSLSGPFSPTSPTSPKSSFSKTSAVTLHLPAALYVAGRPVRGHVEIDYPLAQLDGVRQVSVSIQGILHTRNRQGEQAELFVQNTTELLNQSVSVYMEGRDLPERGDHIMRLPFVLELPADAPPSFEFNTYWNVACVRYSVEVTVIRISTYQYDRLYKTPIPVVTLDPIGATLRSEFKTGWNGDWGRAGAEMRMRKFPWGEYGNAKMELMIPHISTFPLFTAIPYTIIVTTWSAPVKRKHEKPSERFFPPVPTSASEIDFELRRYVDLETPHTPSEPEEAVCDIISKARKPNPPVSVQISDYKWTAEGEGDEQKGCWMQQATFRSQLILRCTPTFSRGEIKTRYYLQLRVAFPGMGNALRLQLPLTIGSGVEAPIRTNEGAQADAFTLDLPSTYWDTGKWGPPFSS